MGKCRNECTHLALEPKLQSMLKFSTYKLECQKMFGGSGGQRELDLLVLVLCQEMLDADEPVQSSVKIWSAAGSTFGLEALASSDKKRKQGQQQPGSSSSSKKSLKRGGSGTDLTASFEAVATEKDDGSSTAGSKAVSNQQVDADLKDMQEKISKCPITRILVGEKLGLFIHHAAEKARSLPAKYVVVLRNHVKLCRHAEAIQPSKLDSISQEELNEALDALLMAQVTFPLPLLLALWQSQVKEKVTKVHVGPTKASVTELFDACRPLHSSETKKMEVKNLVLGSLDINAEQRAKLLTDVIIGDLCIPLLLEGKSTSHKMMVIAKELLTLAEAVLMANEDLDDALTMVILDIQWLMRSLCCLMADDVMTQTEGVEDIKRLKEMMAEGGTKSPLQSACVTLGEVSFYMDLMKQFSTTTANWETHRAKWHHAMTFLWVLPKRSWTMAT